MRSYTNQTQLGVIPGTRLHSLGTETGATQQRPTGPLVDTVFPTLNE